MDLCPLVMPPVAFSLLSSCKQRGALREERGSTLCKKGQAKIRFGSRSKNRTIYYPLLL
jgi:hypothetical protein